MLESHWKQGHVLKEPAEYRLYLLRWPRLGTLTRIECYFEGCTPFQFLSIITDDRAVEHVRTYFWKLINRYLNS